jgi:hypothetical protein
MQTAWFKALCALLLVLAGVGLYRYRIALLTAPVGPVAGARQRT